MSVKSHVAISTGILEMFQVTNSVVIELNEAVKLNEKKKKKKKNSRS